MSRFEFIQTTLKDLKLVKRTTIEDHRGCLSRLYSAEEYKGTGVHKAIAQINLTFTRKKGAVRGFHFQRSPHAETKIVSCLKGKVFDVAVDLRQGSSTFLHWHGEILSSKNSKSFLIPEGFAHGFQALTEDCELLYFHTSAYQPEFEGALNVKDPRLNVSWPLPLEDLSERDRNHSFITPDFQGILL